MVSFLPLKHFRALPRFAWYSLQVQRQLARSNGLLGYSLDADILRLRFWTLSAWEDRQSLTNFVDAIPHQAIMKKIAPLTKETKFEYWKIDAGEIPLSWSQARARLK